MSATATAGETAKKGLPLWVKLAIAALVLVVFLVGLRLLPVNRWLTAFDEYVEGLGAWGPVVFIGGYAIAGLLVPASVLTLGAGGIFGPWVGTAVVSAGSVLCASIAFLIGRYGARGWIQKKMSAYPKFAAVESAVSQQGFKIVLLTRLSPAFPFLYINYAYGITTVPFWKYLLASWVGMIPGTFLYVYLGYAAKTGAQAASGSGSLWLTLVKLASFIIPTVIVTVIVTRVARKALAQATEPGHPKA